MLRDDQPAVSLKTTPLRALQLPPPRQSPDKITGVRVASSVQAGAIIAPIASTRTSESLLTMPTSPLHTAQRCRRSMLVAAFTALPALIISTAAHAADAAERGFIRSGMAEAEVLLRIGKPDHETFVRNIRGEPEEKTWAYFPHYRDAQTLTIVTLRAGHVLRVDRKIAR